MTNEKEAQSVHMTPSFPRLGVDLHVVIQHLVSTVSSPRGTRMQEAEWLLSLRNSQSRKTLQKCPISVKGVSSNQGPQESVRRNYCLFPEDGLPFVEWERAVTCRGCPGAEVGLLAEVSFPEASWKEGCGGGGLL